MRVKLISLFLLLTPLIGAKSQIVDKKLNQIDVLLHDKASQGKINGILRIQQDGRILFQKAYGYGDWNTKTGIQEHTIFRIGSLTKQFVAALILKLEEEGKLSTTDPISKYIPDYPRGNEITIEHLVKHSSGIPNFIFFPDYGSFMNQTHTRQQMIVRFRDLPLEFKPGTQYNYSNSGYYLLGVIVEKVTGKSFAEALREKVIEPLGLANTGFWPEPKPSAKGYQHLGANPSIARPIDSSVPFTAGGMYSSVADLDLWQNKLFSSFLNASYLSKLLTPGFGNYGYGLWIDEVSGRKRIWHTGGINGFRCVMSWYPNEKINIIFLGNLEGVDTELLEGEVHDLLLK
jgi:CubicO group peptidase (beta-lactamase class C family)